MDNTTPPLEYLFTDYFPCMDNGSVSTMELELKTETGESLAKTQVTFMRECVHRFLKYLLQPLSQGSLSCFEKEPWLWLVTWKYVSINCTAMVGPQINFVDWTMKYHLG